MQLPALKFRSESFCLGLGIAAWGEKIACLESEAMGVSKPASNAKQMGRENRDLGIIHTTGWKIFLRITRS